MRIATLSALVCITLGSALVAACGSDSGGGGNTGGATTVGGGGGAGGVPIGGAGGGGGSSATGGGGAGGAGGSSGGPSCKGVCGSTDDQGGCYCDPACKNQNPPDCCKDYDTECAKPTVKLPDGCVKITSITIACNPVTNEGCSGQGVACDFSTWGQKPNASFTEIGCYGDSTVAGGQVCEPENKKFCAPKHRCDGAAQGKTGICKQFCCASTDCPGGGNCVAFDPALGTIGVCEGGGTDGGTEGGTDGGGGTGGATSDASTDASGDAATD